MITALIILAVLAGVGLAVTMVLAGALRIYRSVEVLRHLCHFGDVHFSPDGPAWSLDEAALRNFMVRRRAAVGPLLTGIASGPALLVLWLLLGSPALFPGDDPDGVSALALAGIAATAAALVFWRGRRLIRSRQEAACRKIAKVSAARWQKVRADALPKFQALQELSKEIIAAGEAAGWQLTTTPFELGRKDIIWHDHGGYYDSRLHLDYVPLISRCFAKHFDGGQEDTALMRSALDAAQRDLRQAKAAFLDAAACYWEALAAGCEAEIVLKKQGMKGVEDGLQRYAALMEQLYSPSFRAMLEAIARGEGSAEYKGTVTAIKEGTAELLAEATAQRMNKSQAYIVLGLRPDAPAEEINRTCRCLLELRRPADSSDKAAISQTDQIKQAQAFLKEQGHA